MQRLSVVLAATALAVAILGSTSLGTAAGDAVKAGVRAATRSGKQTSSSRGPRGPRGPRGYRGYRGLRGFQGPPGDAGPSNAYEFQWTTQVPITGTVPTLPTIVAAPSTALAAGKYTVSVQMTIAGASEGVVSCRGRESVQQPGQTGRYFGQPASVQLGSGAGSARTATLALTFGVDYAQPGPLNVVCWETGTTGATAGPGDLIVTLVGALSSIT